MQKQVPLPRPWADFSILDAKTPLMDCQLTLVWELQPDKHNWKSSFVRTFYHNEDEAKKTKPKKKSRTYFFAQTLPGVRLRLSYIFLPPYSYRIRLFTQADLGCKNQHTPSLYTY